MNEPREIIGLAIMVLGIVSILGSLFLYSRRKVPEGNLARTTLLIVGLALTQVGMIADNADNRDDLFQVGLLALLLLALSVAAFVEGWRRGGEGPRA